jgi:putative peptidoglycan lipid II flippase
VGEGAASWLNYAFRLMQLPIGVFGVAVATVTLPALSRAAVHGVGDDFRDTLAKGLRLVFFLVLPATVGLVILAEPIVSVLYERGAFDAQDRAQTAAAMRAYGYGLLCYAALKVLQPAFYAMDRRWVPMMLSLFSLAINVGCNWLFVVVLRLGHEWLALTTSISATINFVVLYVVMRRLAGPIGTGDLLHLLGRIGLAAGVMAALCYAVRSTIFVNPADLPMVWRAGALCALVGISAGLYFGLAICLRVREARDAAAWLQQRWGR